MPVWGLTSTSWSHTGKITCPDEVIKSGFSFEDVEIQKGSASVE